MLKLSIIIPVYNVEKYIRKCIQSCLDQDLPKDEYEIIVVNDGTPDNSICVVEDIIKNEAHEKGNCNIRIVNRENGGLSAARNTGLKNAKGDYVWFVDSDDWIEKTVLGKLTETAYKNYLDVLCFKLQLVFPDGQTRDYSIKFESSDKTYKGPEFITKVEMPPAAWAALYRRDFLLSNELMFYEGILHEDQEFTPRAYFLAQRIVFFNHVAYFYFQRQGGIMKSGSSPKKCKDLLTVADSLYSFMKHYVSKDSDCYNCFLAKINFAFSQSLAHYTKNIMPLTEYKGREYYPLKGNLGWKYRMINISLKLYLFIYKLVKK